jgi:hypothetical protein
VSRPLTPSSREIIAWYEDLLERTFPPTDLAWEPVKIGPTWQYDNGWSLPTLTLGWRVLAWCGVWLRDKNGKPWQFTAEQTGSCCGSSRSTRTADFVYHSAVLQRLKGWGKDPLAACIAVAAMFADVTFDHWDGDVRSAARSRTRGCSWSPCRAGADAEHDEAVSVADLP